jgi:hypothetical protein
MIWGNNMQVQEKAMMVAMLQEFFDNQLNEGLEKRFATQLSDDMDLIVKEFNDYVINKNLKLDPLINKINFHDAIKMIMDEVCAFKIKLIKYQHKIVTESAEMAKEMATIQKVNIH